MSDSIPKMTHKLGKYWEQPNPEDIAIDQTDAMMTDETFEKLKEYSASSPSGVYEGKMWKCKRGSIWYLLWYSDIDEKTCDNNFRIITICN